MSPVIFALLLAAQEPAAASAKAPEVPAERIPAGAPKDDFGLVAWCDGVLGGHMDLAERVQDVLPLDPVQQKVGKSYLDAYERALATSKEGGTKEGKRRAQEVRAIGWKNWDKARAADKQLAADTYINWELPGVCEAAAIRLSGDKDLFRMSPTAAEVASMGESTPLGNAQAQPAAPAPPADPSGGPAASGDVSIMHPASYDATPAAPAAANLVSLSGQPPAVETPAAPAEPEPTPSAAELGIKTIPDAPTLPGASPADAAATPADGAKTDEQKTADKPKKKGWFDWIPH